jgi:hypothetical protein
VLNYFYISDVSQPVAHRVCVDGMVEDRSEERKVTCIGLLEYTAEESSCACELSFEFF